MDNARVHLRQPWLTQGLCGPSDVRVADLASLHVLPRAAGLHGFPRSSDSVRAGMEAAGEGDDREGLLLPPSSTMTTMGPIRFARFARLRISCPSTRSPTQRDGGGGGGGGGRGRGDEGERDWEVGPGCGAE